MMEERMAMRTCENSSGEKFLLVRVFVLSVLYFWRFRSVLSFWYRRSKTPRLMDLETIGDVMRMRNHMGSWVSLIDPRCHARRLILVLHYRPRGAKHCLLNLDGHVDALWKSLTVLKQRNVARSQKRDNTCVDMCLQGPQG